MYFQASELVRHPYLQPYVDQYRPSYRPIAAISPEKSLSAARESRKNMGESQSSNSSCSDRDSLVSSEKNIVNRCNMETPSADEDVDYRMLSKREGPQVTDSLPVSTKEHEEQRNGSEMKQPKTIKNIMISLKEGKARENSSPMRSNHGKANSGSNQRMVIEASPRVNRPNLVNYSPKGNVETKTNADSNKRVQGTPPSLKHQVPTSSLFPFSFSSSPLTETGISWVYILID